MQGEDGTTLHFPDLTEIDADYVEHWEARAQAASHPVLKARYADLVWDLKREVTGVVPDPMYARVAVRAYLDAVTRRLYKREIDGVLSDNYSSPLTTITFPHPRRRGFRRNLRLHKKLEGFDVGYEPTGEESDGRAREARQDRPGRHAGRDGSSDGAQVSESRQATVGTEDTADVAHARRSV